MENTVEVVPPGPAPRWSFSVPDLVEGDNLIELTAKDSNLNESSPPVLVTVTVDKKAPVVTVKNLFDKMAVSDNPLTVTGSFSDSSNVAVAVNGAAAVISKPAFSAAGIALRQGDNTVTVTAVDEAGNVSEESYHIAYKPSSPSEELAYQHIYEQMDKYYKKSVEFKVQAKDSLDNKAFVNISDYIAVTDSWQNVQIPLIAFASQGVDPAKMTAFLFIFDSIPAGGTVYIDDIKLVKLKEPMPAPGGLLIDDFYDAKPGINSLKYRTSDGGSCLLSADRGGVHKIVWDDPADYWYTEVYDGTTPADLSGYDAVSFKVRQADWHTLRLIESYVPTAAFNDNRSARVYDNALAVCALVSRGKAEDLERAKILSYALKYCQDHDPVFTDGRLREAYAPKAFIAPDMGFASVNVPDSGGGDMAWVILSWLQLYRTDPADNRDMLDAAVKLADFLNDSYRDPARPGYFTGFKGAEPNQVLQADKSVVINSAVYAAFVELFKATDDPVYKDSAAWARRFIEETGFNRTDNFFWAGTMNDGVRVNTAGLYIDADAVSIMALGNLSPFVGSLRWAENNFAVTADGFSGYDANRDRDGVWFEGTAQAGIAYSAAGDAAKSGAALSQLRRAQVQGPNANGKGIIAASHDGVTSGRGHPCYASLRAGTTAWFTMLERNVNPLWGTSMIYPAPHLEGRIKGKVTLEGRTANSGQYTFILSNTGQRTHLPAYNPVNDEDPLTHGIQITTNESGDFNLFDVPAGVYDLSVKTDAYLRKRVSAITIEDGADLEGIVFSPLIAGDCNNDNIVDSKDADIVNKSMAKMPGRPGYDGRADVNGDNIINNNDLALVRSNIGKIGAFGRDVSGPVITIDMPGKNSIAPYSPINIAVSGKIDDNAASVTVNGVAAVVRDGVYTASNVSLAQDGNLITVRAKNNSGRVTKLTRTVKFEITAPVLFLENFEGPSKRVGEWWDKNASIVYKKHIQDGFGKDGIRYLKVEYRKSYGYENSAFGAALPQDGTTNDLTKFNQVRFWVYAEQPGLSIRLGIEDVNGGIWEKTFTSSTQNAWEEFIYDFSNTALIDFSRVKNIVFTVNPGDSKSQGSFNLDGLCLVSTARYIVSQPAAQGLTKTVAPLN